MSGPAHDDRERLLANVPPSDSPFLEQLLASPEMGTVDAQRLRAFAEDGYLVLDLDLPDFDALAAAVIEELAPHYPKDDRRIHEAWYFSEAVRRIATDAQVLALLQRLYQRRPIPFQTLNFDSGTEQAAHSDTIHFHCMPRHFMCGVWVALEDVDAENGALFIHPGSHVLPDYEMHDLGLPSTPDAYHGYETRIASILESKGFASQELHLRKGQAVVWTANLFHGGVPIRRAGRTRHSQVTHYYFEDCAYYLPLASDTFGRRVCYREVIDIGRDTFVPHRHRGRELKLSRQRNVSRYPRPLPERVRVPHDPWAWPFRLVHGLGKGLETLRGD